MKGQEVNIPTVSVIMNCLNCAKYLREAVDSVFAQTYTNWEIIFWDNASTDNSAKIAKSYDKRLRYFRSSKTVSLGKARNWALKEAKGKYIAFLDCDDIWLPQKLEKQISLLESTPKAGLVYSNSIFFDQKTGKERLLYKSKNQPTGNVFRMLLSHYFLSLETVIIRKKALDNLTEWFDERFNLVEEADLFIRISHDWDVIYIHEPLAKWRIHEDSWTSKKIGLFATELEMMLNKYEKIYDHFFHDYKKEINKVKARAAYRKAQEMWMKGDRLAVRRIIKPWIKEEPRFLIVYFLSFLSYDQYNNIINYIKNYV